MPKNIGVCVTLKDRVSPTMKQIASKLNMTIIEFNKASKAVAKFSKEVNNRMKAVAQATAVGFGAVVTGGIALAKKTAEAGDRIDKMSQKIGMSRKAFQEWDYVMSQNGGNVDSLQMGYKTLANQMDGVRKGSKDSINAFNKLGVSVRNSNGSLRTQDEVFNEVVRKLQAIKNPTEKAILAQKLFGKSAIEMKPLLNQSAESIEELRDKTNKLGLVLGDDVIDASVKLTDTQDTLNRAIGALGATVGAEFIPIMQKASDFIIDNLPTIKAMAQNVINPVINILKFLADHIKAVSIISGVAIAVIGGFKILAGIGKLMMLYNDALLACNNASAIFTIWQGLISTNAEFMAVKYAICTTATKVLAGAQWLFNNALKACPIILAISFIAGLVAVVIWLYKNWDIATETVQKWGATLVEWCSSAWEKIKEVFGAIGNFIKEHFIDVLLFALGPIGLIIKAVKGIGSAIAGLKNKSKNADVDGGKPPKHALGTSYFQGGATSINEGGRGEIVNLPSGSQIIPHDIAKTQNKNISVKVDFNIEGNVIGKRELFDEFAQILVTQIQNKLQTV